MAKTINIARDFTVYPGPRYAVDGPFSGEKFRDNVLVPALRDALRDGETVVVQLDGVAGYGSSFLEEVFGGLLRKGFKPDELARALEVVAATGRFQHHVLSARKYMAEAAVHVAA